MSTYTEDHLQLAGNATLPLPSGTPASRRFSPGFSRWMFAGVLPLLFLAGCKAKPVDDATLTTGVQSALRSDPSIQQEPFQVGVQGGVVTLTGNASNDTASAVAAQDAAKVKGVKEVVNDIQIAGVQIAPTVTSPEAPANPRPATVQEQQTIATHKTLPPPPDDKPAPAPPAPSYRTVTVPVGTEIPVRISEALSSDHSETGQTFNGVVTRDVIVDGAVVIPAGSAASGHVEDAKDAGHYKGNSMLSVRLTDVRRRGDLIHISTDPYSQEGKGRGKNSAVKIGGGAAIGAVLGGIFGGGKGAAIGSLAGGGGGAAYQGLTHGQQVSIPSETVVRFRLSDSFSVRTSDRASENSSEGGLRRR